MASFLACLVDACPPEISSLVVKGNAQMSEGSCSLQRTIETAGSLVSPFSALFTPNKPPAEFINFLFNAEWPY